MTRNELREYRSILKELHETKDIKLIMRLKKQEMEITKWINEIPDSITRRIFRMKYIEGKTWNKISIEIGGGNTISAVKQRHYRYLRDTKTCI